MGIPVLKRKPTFTQQIVGELSEKVIPSAAKSINEMIGDHNKRKQGKAFGELLGLDDTQSDIYSVLPQDMQQIYAKQLQAGQAAKSKLPGQIHSFINTEMKELPFEQKRKIGKTIEELLESKQASSIPEAMDLALRGPKKKEVGRLPGEKAELSPDELGLFGKLLQRAQEVGPGQVEERQAAYEARPGGFADVLAERQDVTQEAQRVRQQKFEEAKEKGFKQLAKEGRPFIQAPIEGAIQGASFGLVKPEKAKFSDKEEQKLYDALRGFGEVGGSFLPYAAAFKAAGMGANVLTKLSGLQGIPAKLFNAATKTMSSAFIGRETIADLASYGREGRAATKEEKNSTGRGMAAFEAGIQAIGLGKQFIAALQQASKVTGLPKKDIFRAMFERGKNNGATYAEVPTIEAEFEEITPGKKPENVRIDEVAFSPKDTQATTSAIQEVATEAETNPSALRNRITKEFPEQPAARAEKVKEKRPLLRPKEAVKGREVLLAAGEKEPIKPEVELAVSKKAEEKAAREPKRASTRAKHQQIKEYTKEKLIPPAERRMAQLASQVMRLENEMVGKTPERRQDIKDKIAFYEGELFQAENDLLGLHAQSLTAKKQNTMKHMREVAHNKVEALKDDIEAGKPIEFNKLNYNPKRIKMAEDIRKLQAKTKLPRFLKRFDSLIKPHVVYRDVFIDAIKEAEKDLAQIPKVARTPDQFEERKNLLKLVEELKKLRDHANADVTIHKHNVDMRTISKLKGFKEKLAPGKVTVGKRHLGRKLGKPLTRSQQEAFGPVQKYYKEPTVSQAEKISAKTGVPPEQIKAKTEQSKKQEKKASEGFDDWTEDIKRESQARDKKEKAKEKRKETKDPKEKQKAAKEEQQASTEEQTAKTAQRGRVRRFLDEYDKFFKLLFKDPKNAFKTPAGKELLWQLGFLGLDEFVNKNEAIDFQLPISRTVFTFIRGRSPLNIGTYAALTVARKMVKDSLDSKQAQYYHKLVDQGRYDEAHLIYQKAKPKVKKKIKSFSAEF